jgi:hypothetical protein
MLETSYPGRAMLKRDWWPSTFQLPLSLLRLDSDRILLTSELRWARLLVPHWDAAYDNVELVQEVLVGTRSTVRFYKRGSAFRLFFAPREADRVSDILRLCRERGVNVEPGRGRLNVYGLGSGK